MTKQERLEYIRSLGEKQRGNTPEEKGKRLLRLRQKMAEADKLVTVDISHRGIEFNSKSRAEVEVVDATILATVPVSPQEIKETVAEELPAFFEDQRDRDTESEALTADEK